MNVQSIPIFVIILSAVGFAIALYIFVTKSTKKTKAMVCPIGTDCSTVVSSKYGKTFGIENSLFGMLYYLGIAAYFLIILFGVKLPFAAQLHLLVQAATAGAFLFSFYLVGIMQFKLKRWCSWCVLSSLISTGVFVLSLVY